MLLGYYSHVTARAVSIAELKNKLSAYLAEVRRGEELLIRDRKLPIAKIVPLGRSVGFDEEEAQLAAEGRLRLPERRLSASFWRMRAPKVAQRKLLAALHAEREEG
jgi:prevent-host-death family protein